MGAYTLAIDYPEGLCRQRDQRHVARETSDKPPERPAVPKDMAARSFAAYRKQIRGIMILPQKKYGHSSWLTKRIEEQKKLKYEKKLEFSKKRWIWHDLYCIIEIDFELMNSICLFSINDYLFKCLMKSVEKWSLLTGLFSSLPLILLFLQMLRN